MKPTWVRNAAAEAIRKLLLLAQQGKGKPRRYAELAVKKSKKYNVPLKKSRRLICKKCGAVLIPGKNLRVRLASKPKKTIIYTCLECGNKMRFPTGEKLKKRKVPKR